MRDENPIRTLEDYSKPSYEGYRNTIELPVGNNVVPLRSDTIRLVQNGCSFHELRFKDPNQHLQDFLKLVDSLDLDDHNRERTRLHLFQFSLHDQARNWLERLPAGSITTCEDLATRFLAGGKLCDLNTEESWVLLEDLSLYDNEIWNDPRDFAKPVKSIALSQDVPSTSNRRLIKLENQVQHLMEAHLALTQLTQVNKITTSCEICSGPHDTQYCMEDPEQAFVEYASSYTDEAGDARLSKFEADFKRQQGEMTNKINTVLKAITDQIAGTLPSDTVKNPKLGTHQVLSARSYPTMDPQCSSHPSASINAIKAHFKEATISQPSLQQPVIELEPPLELGKNGSTFVQGEVPAKMEDPKLFPLPCRLGDSKPFDTLADLGSCINIFPLYLFKKLNIELLEETDHIFGLADGTKSYPVGIVKDVEVHIGKLKLLNDFYVIDMKKDPKTPLLVGRGFLAFANAVIDCRMAKIAVGEGITRSVFDVKRVDLGKEEAPLLGINLHMT
ncbi:MAK10-like protein [Tanacetum coccineum]